MPKNIADRFMSHEVALMALSIMGLANVPLLGVSWFGYMLLILGLIISVVRNSQGKGKSSSQ